MKSMIMGGALLLAGLALDVYGGMDLMLALSSRGWPTVDGTIETSAVDSVRARRQTSSSAKISYSYTVGGQLLESSQISFGNEGTGSQGEMQDLVNRFAKGSTVKVHYDPSKPANACLIAGVETWRDFMPLIIGLVLTGLGGFSVLQLLRQPRRGKIPVKGRAAR